jgi:hypothetical protein
MVAQENKMFAKSTLLAVAASAALGLAILGSTDALARGHGGGGHGGGHGGFHGGGGMRMHGGGHFRHVHGGFRHHRHWHRHYVRYRPYIYTTPVAAYGVARPVAAGPCTCLTKEYTPEGAVLFRDRCTNEAAMNPPPQAQQQSSDLAPAGSYSAQLVQPTPTNTLPQQPIPAAK